MKSIYTLLLLFSFYFLYSAEICNNGIDDDGNGLIDLNDIISCPCSDTTIVVNSLIPNPSFEDTSCCPVIGSSMACSKYWIQTSIPTPDLMHTCGFVSGAANTVGLLPFPDGNAITGGAAISFFQEYIGTCLQSKMKKDTQYSIQLSIASTFVDGNLDYCAPINLGPLDMTIFGNNTCSGFPYNGNGCPPSPWYELGKATYTPEEKWSILTITFTPREDVYAIILGTPCTLPNEPGYQTSFTCYPYFYYDNLVLNKTSFFSNIDQIGSSCSNNLVLKDLSSDIAQRQWYLNGVALVGKTDAFLNVSANNLPAGKYTLTKTKNGFCNASSLVLSNTTARNDSIVLNRNICLGDTVEILGQKYYQNGSFRIITQTSKGCDSIIKLNITVKPLPSFINNQNICQGSSYTINGKTYTTAGSYRDTLKNLASNGCDSIVITNLTVSSNPPMPTLACYETATLNTTLCQWIVTGTQPIKPPKVNCWDNFVFNNTMCTWNNIGVQPVPFTNNQSICQGNVYSINGKNYSTAGSFRDTLKNAASNGCDSIVITNLSVKLLSNSTFTNIQNVCQGSSYTINGKTYSTAGSYRDTLKNVASNGCDSIIITILTVTSNPPKPTIACYETATLNTTLCQWSITGTQPNKPNNVNCWDNFVFNNTSCSWNNIGTQAPKPPKVNCWDNFVFNNTSCTWVNIGVQPVPFINNQSICQGNVYSINGKNYNTAGSYRDTLKNAASNGCDSIVNTNLTVKNTVTFNNPQTICFGKSYTINGKTYTMAGNYIDTLKNASVNGCDSIIITKLTITPILQGNKQDAFCEGNFYTLPSGKQVNMAGTYKDTIKNNAGCDSVVTIILKEKMNSSYKYAETICSNETYSFFGQQLNTTGKYTHQFIPAANGCDSTVELNLTVNPAPSIKVTATPTKVAFQQDIQLNIETNSSISDIVWRPAEVLNNPNLKNPIAKINEPTWFVAEVSNNVDCKTSDSVLVSMKEVDCFYFPNTFTPNGNNKNDTFKPLGKFFKEIIIFRIFDRWGNMVFETTDPKIGWDGTYKGQALEPDVFFYYIEGICIDGTKQFKKGDVTLIR